MTEQEKAARFAAWLDAGEGAPLPEELDEDVLATALLLRPDMSPVPRVSLNDILAGVREGPFACEPAATEGGDAPVTEASVVDLGAWKAAHPTARSTWNTTDEAPCGDAEAVTEVSLPAEIVPFTPVQVTEAPTPDAARRRPWWARAGFGIALAAAAAGVLVLPQVGQLRGPTPDPVAQEAARRAADEAPASSPMMAEAMPPGTPAAPATSVPVASSPGDGGVAAPKAAPAADAVAENEVSTSLLGGGLASGSTPSGLGGLSTKGIQREVARGADLPAGYGSGASGTAGGAWRTGPGSTPAPEANRAPVPAVGATPVGAPAEERRFRSEGATLPEMESVVPDDLAAAPAPPPVAAAVAQVADRGDALFNERSVAEALEAKPAKSSKDAEKKAEASARAKGRAAAVARSPAQDVPLAATVPATVASGGPGGAYDLDENAARARRAALPKGYAASWWASTPDVAVVFGRAAARTGTARAEVYLELTSDARITVAQDAAWRAASALRATDRAWALLVVDNGLARGGTDTPFRANLVVLKGDLLWEAGRRGEAVAAWTAR